MLLLQNLSHRGLNLYGIFIFTKLYKYIYIHYNDLDNKANSSTLTNYLPKSNGITNLTMIGGDILQLHKGNGTTSRINLNATSYIANPSNPSTKVFFPNLYAVRFISIYSELGSSSGYSTVIPLIPAIFLISDIWLCFSISNGNKTSLPVKIKKDSASYIYSDGFKIYKIIGIG